MSHFNYALVPGTIFSQLPESFINTFTTIEQNSFQNLIPFQGDQIFHTGYSITDDKFQSELEKVNAFRIIEKLNIRRFSFDVGPCYRKTDTKNARYVGVGEKVSQKEIFELCEQKLDWFRKHVPDTCEIAIENLNYYPTETGAYEEGVCEPEFYNEVCRNFGVNLVLDLGHALVSAWNLNLDKTEYLERFDLELISEIQICKMAVSQNQEAYDAHDCPDEVEFNIVSQLFGDDGSKRDMVIEFWKDAAELMDSYKKLKAFFDS